jgi:hypothetical protein
MPTTEQILSGLKSITNTWWQLAFFWHIYFGAIVIALIFGVRLSKRLSGILLSLPILSVSFVAWISLNPFNGILYALIGILMIIFSIKLPREKVSIAPLWIIIPGIIMFIFGWVYPHFLEYSSSFAYLYAAPTGLIPCPTLSIVIGLMLILNGLESRALMLLLGIIGLYYGITGVIQLGVLIDLILLLGAIMILIVAFARKRTLKVIDAGKI